MHMRICCESMVNSGASPELLKKLFTVRVKCIEVAVRFASKDQVACSGENGGDHREGELR